MNSLTRRSPASFWVSKSDSSLSPIRRISLPIVGRAIISVVVLGGVVTPVVGVDVGIAERALRPPEIGTPIGMAEQSLWPRFVDVAARNISFCRLSRHGQNCSRHHRENAEQGVAGLAHSPLRSIRSARGVAQGLPDRTSHTRFEGAYQFLSEGTA